MSYKSDYNAGYEAYKAGKPKEANPYGVLKIQERCWWSAGWSDAKAGWTKKSPD